MIQTWDQISADEQERAIGLVLALIAQAGGKGEPGRFARRPVGSHSREAFGESVKRGYLDTEGDLTTVGRERLAGDDRDGHPSQSVHSPDFVHPESPIHPDNT